MRRPSALITAVTTAALAVSLGVAAPADAGAVASTPPSPPIPVGWPTVTSATETAPVTIAPGVRTYSENYVTADGPEHVEIVTADLTRRSVALDTVESHDRIADPADETTTSMGDRTGALAGINGDYFAIHAAGSPDGGVVSHGRLLKSPRPSYQGQFWVGGDGRAHIGEVDFHGTVRDGGAATAITSLNTLTDAVAGGISELTPDLGASPVTNATLVIGRQRGDTLVAQQVVASTTSAPALARGQLALLGGGAGGAWLQAHVHAGDRVHVSATTSRPAASALISGATVLVRNGAVYDDPTGTPPSGRNPETMIGVSDHGRTVTMVVIDGRQPGYSIGVTPLEGAEYLVAHHDDSGLLLDGGGSSTIAARLPGTASLAIVNKPSDAAGERPVANGLFVYRRH